MKNFGIGLAALLLFLAAGTIFAADNMNYDFEFNEFQTTEFKTSLPADFTPSEMSGGSSGFMTQSPIAAGLLNVPLGLWSWVNRDWYGGGMTTGLEAGGLALFFIGLV